jgi:hypothetical protein
MRVYHASEAEIVGMLELRAKEYIYVLVSWMLDANGGVYDEEPIVFRKLHKSKVALNLKYRCI